MEIDFSKAKTGRMIHPAGWYEAECIGFDINQKDDGRVIVKWIFTTAGGQLDVHNRINGGDNNSFILKTLSGLGLNVKPQKYSDMNVIFRQAVGKRCIVHVEHEDDTYQGRPSINMKVSAFVQPGSPSIEHVEYMKLGTRQEPDLSTAYEEESPF